MKKYKNYIIAAGILILGVLIGKITSGSSENASHDETEHNLVKDEKTQLWTCSMHPQIRMDKPGNCPICGMELIPLEEESNESTDKIASNEIVMTPEAIQLANIQTSKVTRSAATKEIRLLGTVKPDERRLYSQVSHIPGRIEKLYVNFTGEKVRRGQRIVRLYSPELISAQKELFEAIKSKDIYPQLFTAARNKLKLWKLSDKQIEAIIKSGKVQEEIDILSDYSGYVMKRNVELGDHVMEGMSMFEIANLDKIWVMFEAYETDIAWIKNGDLVEFTVQALPGKTYKGKVTYIDPFVSPNSRVAKVRVEVSNPGHKLLPEMFANGLIKATLKGAANKLVIPKSAVLWTGKRAVVYVKVPHEKTISFVYREVILGADLGNFYIVEKGLEEGEEVATNGVFRIDASAQLLGQKSMMNPEGGKVSTGGHAGMDMGGDSKKEDGKEAEKDADMSGMIMVDKSKIDPKFKTQLGNVVDAYIGLKDALANDDAETARKKTADVRKAIKNTDMLLLLGDAHNVWMKTITQMEKHLSDIEKNSNIDAQRKAFIKLGKELSDTVEMLGFTPANGKTVYLEFCPMADDNKGGFWLSYDKEIKNPFFGSSMPTCGEVKKEYK